KKRNYDTFGHAGPGAGVPPGGDYTGYGYQHSEPFGEHGDVDFNEFDPRDFQGGQGGFQDIFGQLFGEKGAFGRGRRPRGASENLGEIEYPVTLSFDQAARGTSLPVQINRGNRTETVEVKVPAGVKTGSRIRLKGRGGRGPDGPSDLFIIVNVTDHPYFRREGNDILLDVPLSIYEAIRGVELSVPTLEGPETIKIPGGMSSGTKIRIKGRGVKRASEQGDQFVVIKIIVPKSMSTEDKQLLEEIARRNPVNARADVKW
ncbi:MAG TPA: J domain-containing protein, partial [Tepidisphaeraceae bacterium]|nr:J domain-containing protein [Tepidisphaeraceae bacterium]